MSQPSLPVSVARSLAASISAWLSPSSSPTSVTSTAPPFIPASASLPNADWSSAIRWFIVRNLAWSSSGRFTPERSKSSSLRSSQ